MKEAILAKLALSNADYSMKGYLIRYVNREFKGNIEGLRKGSKTVRELTEVKEFNTSNQSNDED